MKPATRSRIIASTLFCLVVGGATGAGVAVYRHHQTACAPSRRDAAAHLRASLAAMDQALHVQPTAPGVDGITQSFNESLAYSQTGTDERKAYFAVVVSNASCFSDANVSDGRDWLRKQERRDGDVQSYWYCWDSGALDPHHYGHHVLGDHQCTYGELKKSGKLSY